MGITGVRTLEELGEQLHVLVGGFDARVCDGRLAKEYVEAFARLERLAVAGKTLALAQVDRTRAWAHGEVASRSTADWLAAQTGTSLGEAIRETNTARRVDGLSATKAALRDGRLSGHQVCEIADAATDAPHAEERLLGLSQSGTFEALRKQARHDKAAAGEDRERAERQHSLRRARRWTDREGMRCYGIALTPGQAARFEPTWDRYCNQVGNEARKAGLKETGDAYAADALVRMAEAARLGGDTPGGGGSGSPVRAHALLRIDASALHRGHTTAGETCEVAGIGPIDVASAKALLGDAIVDIVIADGVDVRTVAHAGRTANRHQKAALLTNWECEIRDCNETRNLEIDHIVPYAESGITDIEHLGPKCRWHHHLKTHKGWHDSPRGPDGKRTLINPNGPDPPDPLDPTGPNDDAPECKTARRGEPTEETEPTDDVPRGSDGGEQRLFT